jgi:sporulation-control protein spo0M
MKLIDIVKSLAASNGIQCKVVDTADGVQVVIPCKQLMGDYFIEMLLPDGATGRASGLGLIDITRKL